MARRNSQTQRSTGDELPEAIGADWQRRVVGRSLRTAAERSVDRGMNLIRAAAAVIERADGEDITVQEVADEAGQSLRTLYQYFESKDDLLLAVFEEAMRTYAVLIEQSISQLDDPLERLAGAMVAAVRMPEVSGPGFDRGLVRLRLRLSQTRPELVARAQEALTSLVGGLVEAAAGGGRLQADDPEAATFMILSLNAAVITAGTVGNDAGVHGPDPVGLASFCLRGLGAHLEDSWYESINARLRFPKPPLGGNRSLTHVGESRATGRRRAQKA
jgi:AcrR family transcriptional regulator